MMVLSPAEEEAEQLMRQAAMAWNMQQNRELAEKMQRRALEAVTKEVRGWGKCWLTVAAAAAAKVAAVLQGVGVARRHEGM